MAHFSTNLAYICVDLFELGLSVDSWVVEEGTLELSLIELLAG